MRKAQAIFQASSTVSCAIASGLFSFINIASSNNAVKSKRRLTFTLHYFLDKIVLVLEIWAWGTCFRWDGRRQDTSNMSNLACVHLTRCPVWRLEIQVTSDAKFSIRAFCRVSDPVSRHLSLTLPPGDVDGGWAETKHQAH